MDGTSLSISSSDLTAQESGAIARLFGRALLLLPLLATLVGVNYFGDPVHLFRGRHFESVLGAALAEGKGVVGLKDYDERLMQKGYVEHLSRRIPTVVFGSSRAMQIGENVFPPGQVFNSSVSGASVEDLMALYELYRARGMLPSTLIVGADPWLLNRFNGQRRYRSLSAAYQAARSHMKAGEGTWLPESKWAQLLSPSYFQASVASLSAGLKESGTTYRAVDRVDESVSEGGKRPDGRQWYERAFRTRTEDEVRRDAIRYAEEKDVYSLSRFVVLDPGAMGLFEALIRLMKEDGVRVVLYLPPYHPETYHRLLRRPDTAAIADAERYFRELAIREGLRIVGSYDPVKLGLDGGSFFDGMHAKDEAVARIFSSSLEFAPPPAPSSVRRSGR